MPWCCFLFARVKIWLSWEVYRYRKCYYFWTSKICFTFLPTDINTNYANGHESDLELDDKEPYQLKTPPRSYSSAAYCFSSKIFNRCSSNKPAYVYNFFSRFCLFQAERNDVRPCVVDLPDHLLFFIAWYICSPKSRNSQVKRLLQATSQD